MRRPEAVYLKRRHFVILLHEPAGGRGEVHYDLLIESPGSATGPGEGVCLTWSFARPPARRPQRCRRIFDHPSRFLTYEGPLREGLGRVHRHDAGTCQLNGDPDETLVLTLTGDTISGTFGLQRLSADPRTGLRPPKGFSPQAGRTREPTHRGDYLWRPTE